MHSEVARADRTVSGSRAQIVYAVLIRIVNGVCVSAFCILCLEVQKSPHRRKLGQGKEAKAFYFQITAAHGAQLSRSDQRS